LSGDIRKAFQICRVAAETVTHSFEKVERQSDSSEPSYPKIKISDIQKASQESFNKAIVTAVSFCTPLQVLLLIALASLCRTTGREVGGFAVQDVITKMGAIASGSGDLQYLRPPSFSETIHLVSLLGEVSRLSFEIS
jgi:Cdc6-like AAA superfamily ATPase